MRFVLHDGVVRQVQNPLQRVPDPAGRHSIRRRAIPHRYDVLHVPHADHGAAYLVADRKLLAEDGQHQVLPAARG